MHNDKKDINGKVYKIVIIRAKNKHILVNEKINNNKTKKLMGGLTK